MGLRLKTYLKIQHPGAWKVLTKLRNPTAPVPIGLWILNTWTQRVLGINGAVPWMVHFTSRVMAPENIEIGRNVWKSFALSGGCYIQGINGVYIDDDTIFAPHVCIISANHVIGDLDQHTEERPIHIGKRCWLGANAVILPGVTLGDEVVVGAGAVVTKDFPDGAVVAGVPAHILPKIF